MIWSEYNEYKKIDSNSLYYPVHIQHVNTSSDYTWVTQATLNFRITMSASADEYIYIKNPEVLRFENYINKKIPIDFILSGFFYLSFKNLHLNFYKNYYIIIM